MTSSINPFLVSTDWLFDHLDDDDVSIVDGSWYLPAMGRDGRDEYDAAHIPGAVFFDIDEVVREGSALPHTLATPDEFARHAGKLGINSSDTIVVYDGAGLFSAPRVWWNFRQMGAAKAVILDGGLPKWVEDRLPVESGSAPIYPALYDHRGASAAAVSFDEMAAHVHAGDVQIVDARPAGRFTGEEPEPRAGMRSGHMPGAKSLPASSLIRDGHLRSLPGLQAAFDTAGVDISKPVVTTCGSGVTAATLALALESLNAPSVQIYDGSWSEWGGREDTPIETG